MSFTSTAELSLWFVWGRASPGAELALALDVIMGRGVIIIITIGSREPDTPTKIPKVQE